ncbi:MAG: GrpB family protein [Ruminococcus flavefaciens]|jgi:GrpB-like predicted nucleotidyltransferase (UPF0157 family)|nr:GrpB family protein [Ruminococcus flavefaciens]
MSIGMKRGTVYLEDHQSSWEESAKTVIADIQTALTGLDADVQHIGSTAIMSIKAKPIIDIAAAVNDLDEVIARNEKLAGLGIVFRFDERPEHLLYVKGDFEKNTRTHHIHIVSKCSEEWKNYLCFRDYLNDNLSIAREYEKMKLELWKKYADNRIAYTDAKEAFIRSVTAKARELYKDKY